MYVTTQNCFKEDMLQHKWSISTVVAYFLYTKTNIVSNEQRVYESVFEHTVHQVDDIFLDKPSHCGPLNIHSWKAKIEPRLEGATHRSARVHYRAISPLAATSTLLPNQGRALPKEICPAMHLSQQANDNAFLFSFFFFFSLPLANQYSSLVFFSF